MNKSYLLVFNSNVGNREDLVTIRDQCETVITWRYDMTNAIYLVSQNSAFEICEELERLNPPGDSRYMVLEYNGNAQGRTSEDTWFLLNNKYHKPDA